MTEPAVADGTKLKIIIYLLMSKYVITLNNGARSNGRDEDKKKNMYVNIIN